MYLSIKLGGVPSGASHRGRSLDSLDPCNYGSLAVDPRSSRVLQKRAISRWFGAVKIRSVRGHSARKIDWNRTSTL